MKNRDPFEEFLMLRSELDAYNPEMLEKPFLVALNKIDQYGAAALAAAFRARYTGDPADIFEISAKEKIGLAPLKEAVRSLAQQTLIRY